MCIQTIRQSSLSHHLTEKKNNFHYHQHPDDWLDLWTPRTGYSMHLRISANLTIWPHCAVVGFEPSTFGINMPKTFLLTYQHFSLKNLIYLLIYSLQSWEIRPTDIRIRMAMEQQYFRVFLGRNSNLELTRTFTRLFRSKFELRVRT